MAPLSGTTCFGGGVLHRCWPLSAPADVGADGRGRNPCGALQHALWNDTRQEIRSTAREGEKTCCAVWALGVVLILVACGVKTGRDNAVRRLWDEHRCDEKTSRWMQDGVTSPIPHPVAELGQYCNYKRAAARVSPCAGLAAPFCATARGAQGVQLEEV